MERSKCWEVEVVDVKVGWMERICRNGEEWGT
jgi:hypothetical protein